MKRDREEETPDVVTQKLVADENSKPPPAKELRLAEPLLTPPPAPLPADFVAAPDPAPRPASPTKPSESDGNGYGLDDTRVIKANRPALPKPTTIPPCPRCKSNDTKFCYYNNYR